MLNVVTAPLASAWFPGTIALFFVLIFVLIVVFARKTSARRKGHRDRWAR